MGVMRRLLALFRWRRDEQELEREMAAHLALLEDEYRRRGLSEEAARLAARRAVGSVALAKDLHRDARSITWIEDLRRDLGHAVRQLRQAPGFAATAVVTLGLGIAVNNTFFTIVNAICLRGLPIEAPERVLVIGMRDTGGHFGGLSLPELDALSAIQRSFSGVAGYVNAPVTIAGQDQVADRVMGAHVSAAAFDLLGERPVLGRGFRAGDDRPGAPAVVVIGSRVWKTRYAGDPGVVGRTIMINGNPSTVIGVMPDGFRFLQNTDVWQPLRSMQGLSSQPRNARVLLVFGRLDAQAPVDQANAELDAIGRSFATEFPESNRGLRLAAIPINEQMNGRVFERTWLSFITAGALVLLVACANVANLLLMRGAARGREIAIRASIGASRSRLVRQLLIESALLAALGAAVGTALSLMGLRLLSALVPTGALQYWMAFTIDARVLVVLLSVSACSILVFGLAPALQLLKVDAIHVIKTSPRIGAASLPARRWTGAFLALEFALTLVLLALVVTGLRSEERNARAEFPIDPVPLLSMWITLPPESYPSEQSRVAFYDEIASRFGAVPGVSSVTVVSVLPRVGASQMALEIAGRPAASGSEIPTVSMVATGERYFDTLGMPLVRGRPFTSLDGSPGHESAIVNQRLVDMFFGTRNPIGQLIRVGRPGTIVSGPWARIVAVAPTLRQRTGGLQPDPVVYLPHRSIAPATSAILVRAAGEGESVTPGIRLELHRLDPDLPLYRVMSLQRAMDEAGWNGRTASLVAQNIGLIALVMALVGLYAVTSYSVQCRRPEISLRIALGLPPRGVAWIVLRRALAQLASGLGLGVGLIAVWDRLFTEAADPNRLSDAAVVVPLIVAVACVACVACAWPVRRATHIEPLAALKAE